MNELFRSCGVFEYSVSRLRIEMRHQIQYIDFPEMERVSECSDSTAQTIKYNVSVFSIPPAKPTFNHA